MPRRHSLILLTALVLAGCESQLHLTGTPARPPLVEGSSVRAQLTVGAAGTAVSIDDPNQLSQAIRDARDLKVVVAGRSVPVTVDPGGSYTFVIPAGAATAPDVAGHLTVVFVMNDRDSQIVTLSTGSPVKFDTPPVLTDPTPAFIVKGLKVKLKANTAADTSAYQFTWSYSSSGTPPWAPIPGQGKEVEWEPPSPGNFFIKVDAVERASQNAYSTITPSALVFVTDAKDVITTEPTSGAIERGNPVTLKFVRPAGLVGSNLSFSWSTSASPTGPWTQVNGNAESISWLPTATGSFYVKTEVSNRESGQVNTFISPNAVVFVSEGRPIVTASQQSVERGDRVDLTLNIPTDKDVPITWYYSRAGSAQGATWTLINGSGTQNGRQIPFVVNEAGSYNFRVDLADATGSIKTFTTNDPVLNVREGATPLVQSDPPYAVIERGASVDLLLNARGVDEDNYKYTWYVSTNPVAGWSALPIDSSEDATKKRYHWKTEQVVDIGGRTIVQVQPAGAYFVRVDATEKAGNASYTFTSSTAVVTIQP